MPTEPALQPVKQNNILYNPVTQKLSIEGILIMYVGVAILWFTSIIFILLAGLFIFGGGFAGGNTRGLINIRGFDVDTIPYYLIVILSGIFYAIALVLLHGEQHKVRFKPATFVVLPLIYVVVVGGTVYVADGGNLFFAVVITYVLSCLAHWLVNMQKSFLALPLIAILVAVSFPISLSLARQEKKAIDGQQAASPQPATSQTGAVKEVPHSLHTVSDTFNKYPLYVTSAHVSEINKVSADPYTDGRASLTVTYKSNGVELKSTQYYQFSNFSPPSWCFVEASRPIGCTASGNLFAGKQTWVSQQGTLLVDFNDFVASLELVSYPQEQLPDAASKESYLRQFFSGFSAVSTQEATSLHKQHSD